MKSVELYFLNYKFNVLLKDSLAEKFQKFWKFFLTKTTEFEINKEWFIYFSESNNTITQIDYVKFEIHHYYNSECDLTELNNLIRESIIKISAMDGILWIHCSGFSIKNKNFLVIGNKGDGKTTFLLNMIYKGANFIGNDQLPLFEYNHKICTYLWRPDIKISLDYAKEHKISNSTDTNINEKILYLVNNNIPYDFIDSEKMSKRLKKKIILPDKEILISILPNRIYPIDYLIFLDKRQIMKKFISNNIFHKIKNDPETIFAYKLKNMSKYMPYWNKRITLIKLNKTSHKLNRHIIKKISMQTKKIICGNRLEFNFVWNNINQFLKGDS